jgi:hypothetical protein
MDIRDIRVLNVRKDGQTYVFRYAPGCESQVVDEIIRLAEDPDSRLDWVDAARLGFQITQHAMADCYRDTAVQAAPAREGPCSNSR